MGNKNCDFVPETTSSVTWTSILAKEHLKLAQRLGYKPGEGGGGTIQVRASFFHWLLETGALFEIAVFNEEHIFGVGQAAGFKITVEY